MRHFPGSSANCYGYPATGIKRGELGMANDILLPPAVLDLIEAIRDTHFDSRNWQAGFNLKLHR